MVMLMAVLRLQKSVLSPSEDARISERRGDRERDLRINGRAIIESNYGWQLGTRPVKTQASN